jgi:hypothetical protein
MNPKAHGGTLLLRRKETLMVQITLTPEEAIILRDILNHYMSDLRMEIADTDAMDLREKLKNEEGFLNRLLRQLASE